jgi:ketosteroid isomerase-like protein
VGTDGEGRVEAAEVRAIVEAHARAVHDKDIDALMANVAGSAMSYDVVNPLDYPGADAARARAKEWFASFAGPIDLELRDLRVEASADLAFAYSLNRIRGVLESGGEIDMWIRSTLCLRKQHGRWLIVHQHSSVPFDATTGKASLDLAP